MLRNRGNGVYKFAGFHKFPSNPHADSVHTGISLVRLDRAFPVTVWIINIGNRFLSIISHVSCSCSVYTDIFHLLNLQMCGYGFVCAMLDLNLTKKQYLDGSSKMRRVFVCGSPRSSVSYAFGKIQQQSDEDIQTLRYGRAQLTEHERKVHLYCYISEESQRVGGLG